MKVETPHQYIVNRFQDIPTSFYVGMILLFLVGTICFLAFRGFKKGLRWSARLLLAEYALWIFYSTVLVRSVMKVREHRLIPFGSYQGLFAEKPLLLTQVISNVVVFIPIGLLLGCAFDRMKWWKVLLIGGGFSLLIETLQFILKRGFAEVDDVFHNVLGCVIGFGVYKGAVSIVKWVKKKRSIGEVKHI